MLSRFLLATLFLTNLPAQTPTLVRDLNTTGYGKASSGVNTLRFYKGSLYFLAGTPAVSVELYRSLGGVLAPQRLTDLGPGLSGRICWGSLTEHAGYLWFLGRIDNRTYLFRHDGTQTKRIAAVPGCMQMVAGPGFLFLHGYSGFAVSDGTAAGTKSFTRTGWRDLREFTVFGNKLYFRATDTRTHGTELFVCDGTPAGTRLFVDLRPGKSGNYVLSSLPSGLIVHGGKLLFEANDGLTGWNLYASDGTVTGTKKYTLMPFTVFEPTERVALGGKVYFGHPAGPSSYSLYVTDGTASGTKAVKTGLPKLVRLVSMGGKLWFFGASGTTLRLFVSDGTTAGTKSIATVAQTTRLQLVIPMHHDGKRLWFQGHTTTTSWEPWVSDGTTAGTKPVRDINPGAQTSSTTDFATIPTGKTLFGASDGRAHELWVSDGTSAGTRLFADIDPSPNATKSSFPTSIQDHGGLASFITRYPVATWVTDGTTAGTVRIGPSGSWVRTSLGDKLFLPAFFTPNQQLLVTDGTTKGTSSVYTGPIGGMLRHRGVVYFLGKGKGTSGGFGLWRTTGGTATLVKELAPNNAWPSYGLRATSKQLYIVWGKRLWTSDGTAAGTKEVDLSGVKPAILSIGDLVPVGDSVYVQAQASSSFPISPLLYRTDGTAKGTHVVRDAQGNDIQCHGGLTAFDGRLLFGGRVGFSRTSSLYITDGSAAGTKLLQAFSVFSSEWHLRTITLVAGRAVFFAEVPQSTDIEMWVTDGSTSGTRMVKRFARLPRPSGNFAHLDVHSLGQEVLFVADDGEHGFEPWISDLTANGTRMLRDLEPGPGSGMSGEFAVFRGSMLFSGQSGLLGTELLRVGLSAHTQVLGEGCAVGEPPRLEATTPRLGAALTITTTASKVTTGQRGWFAIDAAARRPLHAGSGCTLHVGAGAFLVPFVPSTKGSTIQVTIPNQPVLHGLDLPMQSAIGPSNQAPFGFDLSNGLLLCVRRR